MLEISTSGLMSGDGKRSELFRAQPPRPSSTLHDALPSLRREPIPNLSHILQLFFVLRVFGFSRDLTTRGGVPFVLQNFLHGGPQYAVDCKGLTVARSAFAIFDLS